MTGQNGVNEVVEDKSTLEEGENGVRADSAVRVDFSEASAVENIPGATYTDASTGHSTPTIAGQRPALRQRQHALGSTVSTAEHRGHEHSQLSESMSAYSTGNALQTRGGTAKTDDKDNSKDKVGPWQCQDVNSVTGVVSKDEEPAVPVPGGKVQFRLEEDSAAIASSAQHKPADAKTSTRADPSERYVNATSTRSSRSRSTSAPVTAPNLWSLNGPVLAASRSSVPRTGKDSQPQKVEGSLSAPRTHPLSAAKVDVPRDLEGAMHALSRIDSIEYEKAMRIDSNRIFDEFVFPRSFPWHLPRALPKLLMPRDIDDLHGVIHAEDKDSHSGRLIGGFSSTLSPSLSTPYGVGFGYGRYETGRNRRGKESGAATDTAAPAGRLCGGRVRAAARRSDTPGVIELAVEMTPPVFSCGVEVACGGDDSSEKDESIPSQQRKTASLSSSEMRRRQQAAEVAECIEATSFLPWYWDKSPSRNDEMGFPVSLQATPSAWRSKSDKNDGQNDASSGGSISDSDDERFLHLRRNKHARKRRGLPLPQVFTKRYKVSVRVHGVSSRETLFPQGDEVVPAAENEGQVPRKEESVLGRCSTDNGRKVLQDEANIRLPPLLAAAAFPVAVQLGKTVSSDCASAMDKEGLFSYLGSYDCRWPSVRDSQSKRVQVGRTRLIWTDTVCGRPLNGNLLSGATPSRVTYTSSLTKRKLEGYSFKRPREAVVGVRVNGELLLEGGLDHTSFAIDEKTTSSEQEGTPETEALYQPYNWSNAVCTLDRKGHVLEVMKQAKRRPTPFPGVVSVKSNEVEAKGSAPPVHPYVGMRYGATTALKFCPPRFECFSLDDGPLRVVCVQAGSMHGCSIHSFLNHASKQKQRGSECSSPVCTVCWSGSDGSEVTAVRECVDCGLAAHLGCCFDQGELLCDDESNHNGSDGSSAAIAAEVDTDAAGSRIDSLFCDEVLSKSGSISTDKSAALQEGNSHWRCAVCSDYSKRHSTSACGAQNEHGHSAPTKKSRRRAKPPSRFTTGHEWDLSSNPLTSRSRPVSKYRPNHRCALCPHSGGAMSRSQENDESPSWTHEVCRIWGGAFHAKEGNISPSFSEEAKSNNEVPPGGTTVPRSGHDPLCWQPRLCAICGLGDSKTDGTILKDPTTKRDVPTLTASERHIRRSGVGLVKCAAQGCHVSFHPFCALLVSKLRADEADPDLSRHVGSKFSRAMAVQRDTQLSSRYSLRLVEVTRTEGVFGSLPGQKKSSTIPVAFCGWHNQARERSLYGCPPAGHTLFSAIRIPPQQDGDPEKLKSDTEDELEESDGESSEISTSSSES